MFLFLCIGKEGLLGPQGPMGMTGERGNTLFLLAQIKWFDSRFFYINIIGYRFFFKTYIICILYFFFHRFDAYNLNGHLNNEIVSAYTWHNHKICK